MIVMVNEISRKPITLHEAKEMLAGIDVEMADQIQKRALDYVSKFAKLSCEEARTLVNLLVKEAGLTEYQAIEVVNVMPKTREELRTFTVGWRQLAPTETLDKILQILSSAKTGAKA
jgi:DNA-directed RNA polymerase subunit F